MGFIDLFVVLVLVVCMYHRFVFIECVQGFLSDQYTENWFSFISVTNFLRSMCIIAVISEQFLMLV